MSVKENPYSKKNILAKELKERFDQSHWNDTVLTI